MSGIYYNNPYANQYAAQNLQYGVDMPVSSPQPSVAGASAAGLASMIPYIGPFVSAGLNFAGQAYQNYKQEQFYNEYMSPAARMAQMRAAGINPNAAAQGISGSSAPQMTAAAPSSAGNGVGEQLGNSVNTALTAQAIKAGIAKTNAETDLTNSLNTEKTITNSYLDKRQQVELNNLVQDGRISRSTADMLAVDAAWRPQMAAATYQELVTNINKATKEIEVLSANVVHEYAAAYQAMMNGNLAEAQIHKVFSDIGLNNATIEKISHEVGEIDARTAATYQDITESNARVSLMNIQRQFQQDYYDIWQNTGFNWNSDVEHSLVGSISNYQIDEAQRMIIGIHQYVKAVGDGRAGSADYFYDKLFGIIGDAAHLGGVVYGANTISNRPRR